MRAELLTKIQERGRFTPPRRAYVYAGPVGYQMRLPGNCPAWSFRTTEVVYLVIRWASRIRNSCRRLGELLGAGTQKIRTPSLNDSSHVSLLHNQLATEQSRVVDPYSLSEVLQVGFVA